MENLLGAIQKRIIALYMLLSSLLVYLGIDQEAMIIYIVFLTLDTITGFVKAWRINKNPTSAKFYYGVVSKLGLLSIPLVVALLFKGLGWEDISGITTSSVLSLFLLAEAYSIIQNIYSIKVGKAVMEYDATKAVIGLILGAVKGSIEGEKK